MQRTLAAAMEEVVSEPSPFGRGVVGMDRPTALALPVRQRSSAYLFKRDVERCARPHTIAEALKAARQAAAG